MGIWDLISDLKENVTDLKESAKDMFTDISSYYTESDLMKVLGSDYPAGIQNDRERVQFAMEMAMYRKTGSWTTHEYDGYDDLNSYRQRDQQSSLSARQEDISRLYRLGCGWLTRGEYEPAMAVFRALALQGHARSQYYLGCMYRNGYSVPKDQELAAEWFEISAENGFAEAYTMLGHYYNENVKTAEGLRKAYECYKKAYEGGSLSGTSCYGLCFEYGIGVEKNLETAASLYEKAAGMGDRKAAARLENIRKMTAAEKPQEPCLEENRSAEDMNRPQKQEEEPAETVPEAAEEEEKPGTSEEKLAAALASLDAMIGLAGVKRQVRKRVAAVKFEKKAAELGSSRKSGISSLHMVFAGNPGTGKTTVARLFGQIYAALGLIKDENCLIECDRDDLVAGYLGQTAPRVVSQFEKAKGGILFIDEAYSLNSDDEFSKEAVDTLVKCIEDYRKDVVVILAGYEKEMREFIEEANPGLKSRFRTWISFEDYSIDEMADIFKSMIRDKGMYLDSQAEDDLRNLIAVKSQDAVHFGNARGIRNLVDDIDEEIQLRVMEADESGAELTADLLERITAEDIRNVMQENR